MQKDWKKRNLTLSQNVKKKKQQPKRTIKQQQQKKT